MKLNTYIVHTPGRKHVVKATNIDVRSDRVEFRDFTQGAEIIAVVSAPFTVLLKPEEASAE
jgi:hypothetical protein